MHRLEAIFCAKKNMWRPLYAAETEQNSAEAGTSEKNMEYVRRTMLSAKVQDVVAKMVPNSSVKHRRYLINQEEKPKPIPQ